MNSTVKEVREASNKSLPRGNRRKHERVSGSKNSAGSWFHSMSGQT